MAEFKKINANQQLLYIFQEKEPNNPLYNLVVAYEINGDFNLDKFKEGFDILYKNNESFYTNYKYVDGEIVAYLNENHFYKYFNYSKVDNKEIALEKIKLLKNETINLSEDPIMKVYIFEVNAKQFFFVIKMHHIGCDIYSQYHVMSFLSEYYNNNIITNSISLEEYLSSVPKNVTEEYKEIIKDYSENFLNDTDSNDSFKIKTKRVRVDRESFLKQCKDLNISEFVLHLSAYALLLKYYLGEEKVCLSIPLSGRASKKSRDIIAYLVNIQPLILDFKEIKTVGDLFKLINTKIFTLLRNQNNSILEMQSNMQLPEGMYFDFSANYYKNATILKLNDCVTNQIKIEAENCISPCNITLEEREDLYDLVIEYKNDSKFKEFASFIEKKYTFIINQLRNKENYLNNIFFISEEEKKELLERHRGEENHSYEGKTIAELFESKALEIPEQKAAVYFGETITYGELNRAANRIANHLREKGIGREDRVGIIGDRSIEYITGVMGILKAGGAYVPVNPTYPEERIEYMLKDSGSKIVLTQEKYLELTKRNSKSEVLLISECGKGSDANPEIIKQEEDIFACLYTSGTTGEPKGAMLTEKGEVNMVEESIRSFGHHNGRKILMNVNISFDPSPYEICAGLIGGCTLYITDDVIQKDLDAILKFVEDNGIQSMLLTTSYVNMIMSMKKKVPACLETLITGGDLLRGCEEARDYKLFNIYGPTEASMYSTFCLVGQESIPSIGKPVMNVNIYIVDRNGQLCPEGVAGELWIGGKGVSRGFINKPELTKEKYIESPWKKGERIYKSGDLGRWLDDGSIEFRGRIDTQVKIRGYRIEIGEIEEKVENQKGIESCCVLVENKNGNKQLKCYITCSEDIKIDILIENLKKELPEYMVPRRFIEVERIPLTSNGKVDKRKLESEGGRELRSSEYEAPEGKAEEKVAEVWKEVLGAERVGRNDNFFEIGGDSIKAIQVVSRLGNEGYSAEIKDIFEKKTVKAFAERIAGKIEARKYEHIKRTEDRETYRTTSEQQQIYIEHEKAGRGNTNYNMPAFIKIKGKADSNRIEEAFRKLEERHESLRTTFETNGEGELVQRIHEAGRIEIERSESENLEETEKQKKAFIRWFDLKNDSLIRVKIIRTGTEEVILCLDMHHIIGDGMSMSIIIREFGALYRGEELPENSIRYADYAEWQNGEEYGRRKEEAREYWKKVYEEEVPELELVTKNRERTGKGKSRFYSISGERRKAIENYCRKNDLTPFMFYYEALNVMLSKVSGQEDITVGVVEAGRKEVEVQDVIGMFVNTLALRSRPARGKKKSEYEKEIKELTSEAFTKNECPLKDVAEYAGAEGRSLFEVMYVWQNLEGIGSEYIRLGDGISTENEAYEYDVAKFGLTVEGSRQDDQDSFRIEYEEGRYDGELIDRYWKWFERTAEEITREDCRLGELKLISEKEEQEILERHREEEEPYPFEKTIVELFEERAEEQSEEVAVEENGKKITYGELNRTANRIANHLREKGIGREDRVGIIAERGIEVIEAILGILKAGGAYVPADPEYPEERISYMMEDSGAKLVLCDERNRELAGKVSRCGHELIRDAASGREDNPERINRPEDLIYIIYTSGTTGKPKGVMLEHRNLVNTTESYRDAFLKNGKEKLMQNASLSFDASAFEIFCGLLNGCSLTVSSKEQQKDVIKLLEYVEEKKVTVLFLSTAYTNIILQSGIKVPACVKKLLTAGEQLRYGRGENTFELYNLYGPTEDTIWTTTGTTDEGIPSIGKAIKNETIYIVDRNGQLCPEGVAGELWIGGKGVGRGYMNREELTKEKFIKNPWKEGERIYKSGDLARWMENGELEYLGRIDEQVKIRGYRIETGEIESAIESLEGAKGCCVVVEERNGEKSLAAYVALEEGIAELKDIRNSLSEMLPAYMVPGRFIEVERIPLTSNGKVDKRKLESEGGMELRSSEYEAPEGKAEEKVAEVWKEVLGAERVGRNDNFFEIGGDSIKAIQVVSRLGNEGYSAEIKDIFEKKTVKAFAEILTEAVYEEIKVRTGETALSPIQKWYFSNWNGEINWFNQGIILESEESIDEEKFSEAVEYIRERHDAFRTRYRKNEHGEWTGYVEEKGTEEIVTYVKAEGDVQNLITEKMKELYGRIDIEKGPLGHICVFEKDKGSIIAAVIHHLAVDGVTWRILIDETFTAYKQLMEGKEIKLGPETTSFQSWTEETWKYRETVRYEEERKYWEKENEKGYERIKENRSGKKDRRTFTLDRALSEYIVNEMYSETRLSAQDVLLAALGKALRNVYGINRIRIELESHGRNEEIIGRKVHSTAGWFTNMYPVGLEVKDGESTGDYCRRTKDSIRRAEENGYSWMLGEYEEELQISFNYLGDYKAEMKKGLRSSEYILPELIDSNGKNFNAVSVNGMSSVNGLTMTLDSDLENGAGNLCEEYKKVINEIVFELKESKKLFITGNDFSSKDTELENLDKILEITGTENIEDIYGLTGMQEGMLFHWMENPDAEAYYEQATYTLSGIVNEVNLKKSIDRAIKDNGILRTRMFIKGLTKPRQVVLKTLEEGLTVEHGNEDTLRRYQEEDRRRKFELEQGELSRFHLVIDDEKKKSYLVVSFHHIILDGWSNGILITEIAENYQILEKGEKIPERNKLKFSDYIRWYEKKKKTDDASRYWQNYVEGYEAETEVPNFNKPGTEDTEKEYDLGENLTKKIEDYCRKNGITENVFMSTVLGLLIRKYNGTEDAVIGSITSGRTSEIAGIENLVGILINNRPIRIAGTGRINELMQAQQQSFSEGEKYSYEGIGEIQKYIGKPVNVLYVYENYPVDTKNLNRDDGLKIENVEAQERTNYGFVITIFKQKSIFIKFEVNSSYSIDSCNIMASHYKRIIHQIVDNDSCVTKDLKLLNEEEEINLINLHAGKTVSLSKQNNVINIITKNAIEQPDNIAIREGNRITTYASLNMTANRIANFLLSNAVQRNERISVIADRSTEFIEGILGILKAGCAYVPINPMYPEDRIRYMSEDSESRIILVQDKYKDLAERTTSCMVISISELEKFDNSEEPNVQKELDDIFSILYTSGTTGNPKGVIIPESGILNVMQYMKERAPIDQNAKMMLATNISFDPSMEETFFGLTSGAELYPITDTVQKNMDELLSFIKKNNITNTCLTTGYVNMLLAVGKKIPDCMKEIYTGGDVLKDCSSKTNWDLYNEYGPTEISIYCTSYTVKNEKQPSIGKPIDNTNIYIVDKDGQLCPEGVTGEIWIGSPGVALGYLNKPELTSQKFINSLWKKGERIYKSGDLGRWGFDGNIEFFGRIDTQVKIRGYRIEISEIENTISSLEEIQDCCVLVDTNNGNKQLKCYIVWKNETDILNIISAIKEKLPEYMIPSKFIEVEEIPLTKNDKVDRRKLETIGGKELRTTESIFEAPEGDAEKKLADIWKESLGLEQIGRNDNFFEIGGDSIKAIQIYSKMLSIINCTFNDIFECKTIKSIVEKAQKQQQGILDKISLIEKNLDNVQQNMDEVQIKLPENLTVQKPITESYDNKKVFIAGATGYLGIYLLHEYLTNTKAKLMVLIRGDSVEQAKARIFEIYQYYFKNNLLNFEDRIEYYVGDLSLNNLGLKESEYENIADNADIVINSAAKVDHFGNWDEFEKQNVLTVKNLLKICKAGKEKKFVLVSTTSVSDGLESDQKVFFEKSTVLNEANSNNFYVKSKILGEKILINEPDFKNWEIIRVGNITFESDNCILQKNKEKNAFISKMASFVKDKVIPEKTLVNEYSFVDNLSTAIRLLVSAKTEKQVYHLWNSDDYYFDDVVLGDNSIKIIPIKNYLKHLKEEILNHNTNLSNLLAHTDIDMFFYQPKYIVDNTYTSKVLELLDFKWKKMTSDMNKKLLKQLKEM